MKPDTLYHTNLSYKIQLAYIFKLSNCIVSKREDVQVLQRIHVFNDRNAVVEQTQVLKFHKRVQSFNHLNIIEWQIWGIQELQILSVRICFDINKTTWTHQARPN